jgi:type IX secretion system substrate protein/dockerin type I repeat protein
VSDDVERDTVFILKENYIEVISGINYGDIDNNGVVESYDASIILMYLVGLDPLPDDPVPWSEWRLSRADVDLNEEVNALDAAYVLQYVVAIINEFPVTRGGGNPEIAISLSNDSNYIYLNSDKQIISLEYNVTESHNLIPGKAETERVDCIYYQNKQHLALISAEGISGEILKIPYERINNTECSLVFELESNGFLESISYILTDPVHFVTRLNSIYPNPFNPVTNIQYELAEDGKVIIDIYNIRGQKVETLVDDYFEAGKHSVIWNADNRSSGIYFLGYETGGMSVIRKLMLLK